MNGHNSRSVQRARFIQTGGHTHVQTIFEQFFGAHLRIKSRDEIFIEDISTCDHVS